ncbi:MAG: cupin domain-containing protein [Clostridiales bacterium]|nr:cupin domain-containing protein [Clostridiales bacterium]
MNIVLLSGGSGKRLWPLSNDVRSKQFIKIFKTEDGEYESMVQRVYRQIKTVDADATVTIATSKTQVSAIHNQLGEDVGISVEPCRRDTFPAIALATAYLHDVQGLGLEESVVVCPVDPYVNDDYFEALKALGEQAAKGEANLVLMGIEPTYPSEKYGYIIPKALTGTEAQAGATDLTAGTVDPVDPLAGAESASTAVVSLVDTFKEKPDAETAKAYIAQGALWNGGVFAYKLKYVLDKAHELIDFTDYADLFDKYGTLTKISFDYAVVEKEPEIQVMRFAGEWKDLGTWNTLTEAMDEPTIGDAVLNGACDNVNVVNELNVPIVCMGLADVIVSASPEGILVSDREQSSYIKPIVDRIEQQIMFAEKSWGSFRVIDVGENSLTIKVTLNPGHRMNYHSHQRRDEIWNVISGEGSVIVDGMEQPVKAGDVVTMQAGCRHTVSAVTELKLIEVQLGEEISVYDKQKFELEA